MIKQLATTVYYVKNLAEAKDWLFNIFSIEPYFDEPFYVGYDIGGYELGLLPGDRESSNNIVAYWRVDDIQKAIDQYRKNGAMMGEPMEDVGEGVKVATIIDPFGNHFGVIENAYFKHKD